MEDFRGRLTKMYKHIGKWARRQGITCYRVYDNDVPGYPFSVDLYGKSAYVSIYQKRHLEEEANLLWIDQCLDIISKILEVDRNLVFVKERKRQAGKSQYEKLDKSSYTEIVEENGLSFKINLSDYLDTGLFLDHRNTRQMVRLRSEGKNVLNLFAYTGSFTVYAAAGGARATCTVDLSNTYLNWAKENMALNNFPTDEKHSFLQADVKQFLAEYNGPLFDLIIIDPPTFSNSKRMKDILDTQRDHVGLVNHCLRIINAGGVIYFSTNFRGFQLDKEGIQSDSIQEISHLTVPNDFRNKKIHRCFIIEK